jgi:hypothetical protein
MVSPHGFGYFLLDEVSKFPQRHRGVLLKQFENGNNKEESASVVFGLDIL